MFPRTFELRPHAPYEETQPAQSPFRGRWQRLGPAFVRHQNAFDTRFASTVCRSSWIERRSASHWTHSTRGPCSTVVRSSMTSCSRSRHVNVALAKTPFQNVSAPLTVVLRCLDENPFCSQPFSWCEIPLRLNFHELARASHDSPLGYHYGCQSYKYIWRRAPHHVPGYGHAESQAETKLVSSCTYF